MSTKASSLSGSVPPSHSQHANHIQWKTDPRMAVYRNLKSLGAQPSESASKDEDLKRLLRDASNDQTLLDLPDSITLLAK